MSQLHKNFTDDQVKNLFERYEKKEIERKYLQQILEISKSRFFDLLNSYRSNPQSFSVRYHRTNNPKLSESAEEAIIKELKTEKEMIDNKQIPIYKYNYSFIKDSLESTYHYKISLPTIISRAKNHGFYLPHKQKKRPHDRKALTHYAGELIQHDSSFHLWSPAAKEKWHLITSLDDYSRFILYAALVRKESSWTHILALQKVILQHGCPLSYYVDSHSIFRFVQGRDSIWRNHHKVTDELTPQWKQVLDDCQVNVIYALSPQARGKIERPYQWLQDRLVRMCVREDVKNIRSAQTLLRHEINRYNYKQVHSTTLEVPYQRFERSLKERNSLFRQFAVPPPFQSPKDIFCLRTTRVIDNYGKISLNNLQIKLKNAVPRQTVELRVYPLNTIVSEVRFWCRNQLIDVQKLKINAFQGVQF